MVLACFTVTAWSHALSASILSSFPAQGGVDSSTALTYGFDPRAGEPDRNKMTTNEPDIFSGILTALGVDTSGSGLPDASAFVRT
ncbi:hypothetical protein F0U61_31115 [Archangium violaceum]|uniref:hypothetical protein n=1 Tax=Archangium violaceum TaxID=83451 RepID=UPI002B2F847F|nr:hypothetical protein F0U61_31115 [Archangium violaceum]